MGIQALAKTFVDLYAVRTLYEQFFYDAALSGGAR